ncbi:TetR/AcrR family transcriptional regulator [Kibdelosporangium aridum]|uniref:TetR/AcrR family transcriptional regulator n=1 Tax=Kibdelosporangium aridum TaxID=2030 RepID=UPI000565FC26|nr:TetR/AcrR family transcriptional regulator [Kibdelosporangium aridum]
MTVTESGKQTRTDRRREQILDGAIRVFAEKHYHEAGIADIATDLGIGHGTFYRYFANKKDIVNQAVAWALRQIDETVLQEDPSSSTTLAEHRAMIERVYLRLFVLQDQHPHLIRFLFRQASDPTTLTLAHDTFVGYADRFITIGVDKGFLRPDIDVEIASQALVAVVFDVMRRASATAVSVEMRQRWMSTHARMTLEGLRQPE